jgi:predicted SPOUT superfamily RNA methylase MTH1
MPTRTTVALPASIVSDTPHLREKTAKLGNVARSCSIFGVDQIIIYGDDPDHNQKQDFHTCTEILRFLETPQYLRRRLFSIGPVLGFVGILPPLQIPSHNVPRKVRDCSPGDIREGVVAATSGDILKLDVGLESLVECHGALSVGTRATVKLTSIKELAGELVDPTKISIYWGYRVRAQKTPLGTMLEKETCGLRIGTSRYGQQLKDVWSRILGLLHDKGSVMLAFGSPKTGLHDILQREGKMPDDVFDVYVNMVPNQETLTVRTEEAVAFSLSTINVMRSM